MVYSQDILVDSHGHWLISEDILRKVKEELKERQQIDNINIFLNYIRIVQADDVVHIMKILPDCPNDGRISHYCFPHPEKNLHWHYQIISTRMKSSGIQRTVFSNEKPTWSFHSFLEDGAQLFLMKIGESKETKIY